MSSAECKRGLSARGAVLGTLILVSALWAFPVGAQSGFTLTDEPTPVPTPLPTLSVSLPTPVALDVPVAGSDLPTVTPNSAGSSSSRAVQKGRPAEGASVPTNIVVLLAIGAIVALSSVVVVLAVVLKKPVVINVTSRSQGGGFDGPSPADWIESSAVRMGRPPEGTLKILPGRFVVAGEDGGTEIRIFRTGDEDRIETTIGRDVGAPYRHIQLKPLSVSGKHAKLVYEGGAYSILNYSRTNPTRVNSQDIPEGGSRRIQDEDVIEVGEVVMTYYRN